MQWVLICAHVGPALAVHSLIFTLGDAGINGAVCATLAALTMTGGSVDRFEKPRKECGELNDADCCPVAVNGGN